MEIKLTCLFYLSALGAVHFCAAGKFFLFKVLLTVNSLRLVRLDIVPGNTLCH